MVWGINALKVEGQLLTSKQSINDHNYVLSNDEFQSFPALRLTTHLPI
jgi:hypothetical protein